MLKCVKEGYPKATPTPDVGSKHGTPDCVVRGAAINAVHMTQVLDRSQGEYAEEQLKVIPSGGKQEMGV